MLRHVATEPKLQSLFQYWDGKRLGKVMPDRNDISPIEIGPELLPNILLYESVQWDTRFRYRLIGTEIAHQFGTDPTGKYLDDVLSGTYLDYIVSLLHDVYRHPAAVYSESAFRWDEGGFQRTRRLLLPLSWHGECPGLVLSAQIFSPFSGQITKPLTLIHGLNRIEEVIHEELPIAATR